MSHHAHSRIRPRARDTPHVNSRSTSGQFDGHRQHVPFLRVRSRRRPLRPQVRPPPDAFAAFFYTLAIFRAFPCRATDPPRPRTPPDEQKGRQEGGSALGGRVREEVRVPPHPRAPTPGVTTDRDPKRTETTRMGPGACERPTHTEGPVKGRRKTFREMRRARPETRRGRANARTRGRGRRAREGSARRAGSRCYKSRFQRERVETVGNDAL